MDPLGVKERLIGLVSMMAPIYFGRVTNESNPDEPIIKAGMALNMAYNMSKARLEETFSTRSDLPLRALDIIRVAAGHTSDRAFWVKEFPTEK